MEIIEDINNSLNIYYSLLVFGKEHNQKKKDKLLQSLIARDYDIIELHDLQKLDELEINYRMFALDSNNLNELLFVKNNDISQFNVIYCADTYAYEEVLKILSEKKPACQENVYITKIYI